MTVQKTFQLGLKQGYSPELFNKLVELDKHGGWIQEAGSFWKNFDYEKGLDALLKKDIDGRWIHEASLYWTKFNYKKAFDALSKIDKTGKWIYSAGIFWPDINYKKGLKALKKFPKYYKKALAKWPIEFDKNKAQEINKILNKAKTIKPKKFKLKEEILELIK